ncbi:hypothetical protein M7775_18210 [Sporomusa sphaeroides DSM 2875]|uniref:YkvI family membrane protein n=1 Tax=Sporomusa sphaeroides TaxID=47679 RepID=UPI00202F0F12|nr:hypothetical protein [Sporomusa sphaeroides]MCM0760491.1 hypothetical protein [Sporomusa sphaeroides DSM 2875]
MEKSNNSISISRVILLGGAFIGLLIGSGLATGQEIMQYFVAYHYMGFASIALMFILFVYVDISFVTVGYEQQFEEPKNIYNYYCGKVVGTFFDYFSAIFVYMSFWVMIAGAGALVNQQLGVANWIGGSIVGIATIITLCFGFNRLVGIVGSIGPLVAGLVILLGFAGIMLNPGGLSTFVEKVPPLVESGKILQAGTNWFIGCASYVGFCMMWLAVFMTNIGKTANSKKEASYGAIFGSFLFTATVLLLTLGLAANVSEVAGAPIPTLVLLNKINPALAVVFSAIVFVKIYAAACPLLWTPVKRFAPDEQSTRYNLVLLIMGLAGTIIGLAVPFAKLVNVVYVLSGYIGFLLFFMMVITDFRTRILKNYTPKIVTELQAKKMAEESQNNTIKG